LQEFGQSFGDADLVVVTDIYGAGEPNLEQITGTQVRDAIAAHHEQVYYQPTPASVREFLTQTLKPGDLALFLGAGNLNQVIPQVIDFYQQYEQDLSREARELSQKA
jgi:UDP-N-acetylmuramate--alanine ligase